MFNPRKRLTVEEALAHPYLQLYHNEEDEPRAEPLPREFFFFDYQKEELSRDQLKGGLWGHGTACAPVRHRGTYAIKRLRSPNQPR